MCLYESIFEHFLVSSLLMCYCFETVHCSSNLQQMGNWFLHIALSYHVYSFCKSLSSVLLCGKDSFVFSVCQSHHTRKDLTHKLLILSSILLECFPHDFRFHLSSKLPGQQRQQPCSAFLIFAP